MRPQIESTSTHRRAHWLVVMVGIFTVLIMLLASQFSPHWSCRLTPRRYIARAECHHGRRAQLTRARRHAAAAAARQPEYYHKYKECNLSSSSRSCTCSVRAAALLQIPKYFLIINFFGVHGREQNYAVLNPLPSPRGRHTLDPLLHCKTWGLCLMSWIIYTQQPLALQCNYNMEKSVSHPDKSNIFLMCFRFWLFDSYSTQNCMRELIAHYSLWVSVQNCARAGTQHRRRGVATSDWLNTLDYLAWAGQLDPTLHNILLGRADPYVQLLPIRWWIVNSMLSWFMMQYNDTNIIFLCLASHTHLVRHIYVARKRAGSVHVKP